MILTKTPFRISFAGGGSDYITNSNLYGRVISATIDKYIYVMVNKKHDGKIRISYSKTENVTNVNQIKHSIITAESIISSSFPWELLIAFSFVFNRLIFLSDWKQ